MKTVTIPGPAPLCCVHKLLGMDVPGEYDSYVKPFHRWGYLCAKCLHTHGQPDSSVTTRVVVAQPELGHTEGEPNTP